MMIAIDYSRIQQSMLPENSKNMSGRQEATDDHMDRNISARYEENMTLSLNGIEEGLVTILEISSVTCGVAFLMATFIVFIFSQKARTPGGYCIMNMCATLAISQIVLVIGEDKTQWPILCKITGGLAEFFWASAFFWLNCLIVHSWWSANHYVTVKRETSTYVVYMIFSWGLPGIIVGITFAFDSVNSTSFKSGIGEEFCFIADIKSFMLFFMAPCGFILFISGLLAVATWLSNCRGTGESSTMAIEAKTTLKWGVLIELVMDATLTFKYLALSQATQEIKIVSALLTIAQGTVILLALVIDKNLHLQLFEQRWCLKSEKNNKNELPKKSRRDSHKLEAVKTDHSTASNHVNDDHASTYAKHHPYIRLKREASSTVVQSVSGTYSSKTVTSSSSAGPSRSPDERRISFHDGIAYI